MASALRVASSSDVAQLDTEIRIAAMPVPRGAARPAGTFVLYARHDRTGEVVVLAETNQHLVQDDIVEDAYARRGSQQFRNLPRTRAATVDDILDALAAECPQRA